MSRQRGIGLALILAGVVVFAVAAEQTRGAGGKSTSSTSQRDAQRVVNAITAEFGAGPLGACFWRIAERESKLVPTAANWHDRHADGSRGSFGALQIGALWRRHGETVDHFARRMFNPAQNARLAHLLYERYGLAPWGGSCG